MLSVAVLGQSDPEMSGPADGATVARIELHGLRNIGEGFVRRTIRTREGQRLSRLTVQEDVRALMVTRKFLDVRARLESEQNQAVVIFEFREKPEILSVEIEGNKEFSSDELFGELTFSAGSVLDRYEIDRGREAILRRYQEDGYYYAEVALDEGALDQEGRVVYRVTEGPRVRVRRIVFEGKGDEFSEVQLRLKIRTQTYFWIFRKGAFDEEQADRDAVELQSFYREEGFLDARVGYRLEFENVDRTDLTLVFVIEAGPRYRVRDIVIEGNEVFSEAQVTEVMQLQPGALVRAEVVRLDVQRITDLYGEIGYVDVRVSPTTDYVDEPELVQLRIRIEENDRYRFGRITIRGNERTKDEVARRELRFYPGEDWNTVKARRAEQRLSESGLFSQARITALDAEPDTDLREALVDLEEAQTVDFLVGFGVSTDSGVLGTLTINNRNFDLMDWPRDWGEFFSGQAFRGDGQRLRLQFEPGTELTRFRIDFTEPYLFDRPLRLDLSFYLFERDRGPYVERRAGLAPSISKRFEGGLLDAWAVEGAMRLEAIDIDDVEAFSAKDIRAVQGGSTLTSLKASLVRDTTDSRFIPSEGYRFSLSWEQVGALGGDFDFGRPLASFAWFKTLRTDILDRKSILGVRADAGYTVGDAPVFERFYAGGFGSMRGFDFRGISPRAGVFDDRVGGDFILLAGAEYSVPLYGKNVRGVTFLDMGTVEEDFEITAWRVAVGFGLRFTIDIFGGLPFVLDFGFPIAEQDEDDTRVFNFSFGASF